MKNWNAVYLNIKYHNYHNTSPDSRVVVTEEHKRINLVLNNSRR